MNVKNSNELQRIQEGYKIGYGIDTRFIGDELPRWAKGLMLELLNNCPLIRDFDTKFYSQLNTHQTELARQAAKSRTGVIDIVTGKNFVLINDYTAQPNVQASLFNIQTALVSEHGFTTDPKGIGGAGLLSAKIRLELRRGTLTYRSVRKTIISIATWDPEIKTDLD